MQNKFFTSIRLFQLAFLEEFRRIKKDSGALLILVIAVLFYPIVYSIAYKNNVLRDIPVAVVDLDRTQLSRQAIKMVDATPQMNVETHAASLAEAEEMFWEGNVNGVILIPENFEKSIYNGEGTEVAVYCDVSYFLMYKETLTGSLQAVSTLSAGVEIKRMLASGMPMDQAMNARDPLAVSYFNLYNPSSGYGNFVMPAIILIILQQTLLIGIGMVGGGRHEHQKKLSVSQMAADVMYWPIVLGRSMLYFIITLFNLMFTLILVHHWFGFPDNGSPLPILMLIIPYVFSITFMGIAISQLFLRREHAIMFLVFLSPVVLFLSGVSWPTFAMPAFLQHLAQIFPSTFLVPAYLRLRTMGVEIDNVQHEFWMLILQMVVYFVLANITLALKLRKAKLAQRSKA